MSIGQSYYDLLAKIESSNNPNAKAPLGSASGLYQFTRGTWEGLGYAWDQVFNVDLQNKAVQTLTTSNASILSRAGVAINNATLYAAHFLGAGTAVKALSADPSASLQSVVGSKVITNNPSLKGYSVGDFFGWLKKKTGADVSTTSPFDAPASPGLIAGMLGNAKIGLDAFTKGGQAVLADPANAAGIWADVTKRGAQATGNAVSDSFSAAAKAAVDEFTAKAGPALKTSAFVLFAVVLLAAGLFLLAGGNKTLVIQPPS